MTTAIPVTSSINESDSRPLWKQRVAISPAALGYMYLIYAAIAFFFPASFYESLIREPYFAAYNLVMLLFAFGCVLALRAGVAYATALQVKWHRRPRIINSTSLRPRSDALIIVAILVIVLNLFSAKVIVEQNYEVLTNILIYGIDTGSQLKSEFVSADGLLAANPLLIFVAWMLYSERLSGNRSRLLLSLMLITITLSFSLSLMKLARYELIPLIIGIAVIKMRDLYRRTSTTDNGLSLVLKRKRSRTMTLYGVTILGVFVAFASIRGQSYGANGVVANTTGYFISSFNRLSAILDGQLVMSYGGTGIYTLNFLSNLPVLRSAIGSFLPDNSTVFATEFADIQGSGLVRSYNWLTMYGYYYADLGLWVLLFCFGLGVVAQYLWKSFTDGRVIGTVAYPYFASALILSFAYYWVSRPILASMLIFFALYAACFLLTSTLRRRNEKDSARFVP